MKSCDNSLLDICYNCEVSCFVGPAIRETCIEVCARIAFQIFKANGHLSCC